MTFLVRLTTLRPVLHVFLLGDFVPTRTLVVTHLVPFHVRLTPYRPLRLVRLATDCAAIDDPPDESTGAVNGTANRIAVETMIAVSIFIVTRPERSR